MEEIISLLSNPFYNGIQTLLKASFLSTNFKKYSRFN
jgi:hypothetical protein